MVVILSKFIARVRVKLSVEAVLRVLLVLKLLQLIKLST